MVERLIDIILLSFCRGYVTVQGSNLNLNVSKMGYTYDDHTNVFAVLY